MRSHVHILFTWIHLLLGMCGPIWSVYAPYRSPGIILDSNQVLAMSVLSKASGELSPGPVTWKPINRPCRHLLVTHFHGALFSQQQTTGTGWRLRTQQILTRHPCTDLHRHEDHELACGLLAWSGMLAGTRFYSLPTFKQQQQQNPKTSCFFGEWKEWHTYTHRHFLVQVWAQPDMVFLFFLRVISGDTTLELSWLFAQAVCCCVTSPWYLL